MEKELMEKFKKELIDKDAITDCLKCGESKDNQLMLDDWIKLVKSSEKEAIPCVVIGCGRCGYMSIHGLSKEVNFEYR